jgi:hypothetical protein
MSVIVDGSNGLIFNDASTQTTAASGFGFKNRIMNGAMVIDQRNAGASTNNAGSATTYSLDRWAYYGPSSSKFSIQQSSTAPVDFVNSLVITSLAATSMSASAQYLLRQAIEGYNIADLNWGSANAKTVTLSFWVRSSLTGAFGGSITNGDVNRSYPFSYTISSPDTWEQKSVTIAGPTNGTWNTANGTGLRLYFALGAGSDYNGTAGAWATVSDVTYPTGSTNILGTNGATFYITGVQLERGSTATAFDYRDFGRELIMCQRYYQRCWDYGTATGTVVAGPVGGTWQYNQYSFFLGTGNYGINCATPFPTVMRATPTITIYSAANGTAGSVTPWNGSDYSITSNGGFVNSSTTRITGANYNNGTTAGLVYAFYWTAAAEL